MQNIKDKIKKIEKAKEQIKALKSLWESCLLKHIDPRICFHNSGTHHNHCNIEQELFISTVKAQIFVLEESIKEDVKFIDAIESMLSSGVQQLPPKQPFQIAPSAVAQQALYYPQEKI